MKIKMKMKMKKKMMKMKLVNKVLKIFYKNIYIITFFFQFININYINN